MLEPVEQAEHEEDEGFFGVAHVGVLGCPQIELLEGAVLQGTAQVEPLISGEKRQGFLCILCEVFLIPDGACGQESGEYGAGAER